MIRWNYFPKSERLPSHLSGIIAAFDEESSTLALDVNGEIVEPTSKEYASIKTVCEF